MQDRYTGDIGDFGKLGLLRQLSKTGLSIGVNWYLTPDEIRNSDGRYVEYLKREEFCICDEPLWRMLGQIVASGKRQISTLERPDILKASFYSKPLDFRMVNKAERRDHRLDWHRQAIQQLQGCGIIFADPDNGLIVPSAEGTPRSNKFVLPSELSDHYRSGASVIYYQHKARRPDAFYIEHNRALAASDAFPNAKALGLKFKTTSQRYYFFLMQPQHTEILIRCIENMLGTPWNQHFATM